MSLAFNDHRIYEINRRLRFDANDVKLASLNEHILRIASLNPGKKIISCWQMPYSLVELAGSYIPTGNCDISILDDWLADDQIKHFLYWNPNPDTNLYPNPEEIDAFLADRDVFFKKDDFGKHYIMYTKMDFN